MLILLTASHTLHIFYLSLTDFQIPVAFFQDFPVLENAILKFQDFPGFPGPIRTLSILLMWLLGETPIWKGWGWKFKPLNKPILGVVWAQTPKRCHLKWNRLNYQLLFWRGAHISRLHLSYWQRSRLKIEIRAFVLSMLFLQVRPKRYFDSY